MMTFKCLKSSLRRRGAAFINSINSIVVAALALTMVGCNEKEESVMPYITLYGFTGNESTRITARVSAYSTDFTEYQSNGNGQFMPVISSYNKVAYSERNSGKDIVSLPVGAVYAAQNGYIFTRGASAIDPVIADRDVNGSSVSYNNLRVDLVEGNHIYVPVLFGSARYHLAWEVPAGGGAFHMWTPFGNCFVPTGSDGSNVVAFEANFGAGNVALSYPVEISSDGVNTLIALPAGSDGIFLGDVDLVFPDSMVTEAEDLNDAIVARAIIETGRPQWYLRVPEDGLVSHRDAGLAFDDGELTLPAGALITLPNTDVIFRQGVSARPVSVNADGTVMLWPGSSYDIDQDGAEPTVVSLPGHYDLLTRTFRPVSSGFVTVSFDANGGVVDEASRGYMAELAYGEFPTPVLAGQYFLGWYSDADRSNGVHRTSQAIVPTEDHTLYAGWISQSNVYNVVNGDSDLGYGTYAARCLNISDPEASPFFEFFPQYEYVEDDISGDNVSYSNFDTRHAMEAISQDRASKGIDEAVIVFGNVFGDAFDDVVYIPLDYSAANASLIFTQNVTHIRGSIDVCKENNRALQLYVNGYQNTLDDIDINHAFEIGGDATVHIDAKIQCEARMFVMRDDAAATIDGGIVVSMAGDFDKILFSILVQDNARLTINGGGVLAGFVASLSGFYVQDNGVITINGGAITSLSMLTGFVLEGDSASVVVNGGQFGTSRTLWENLAENTDLGDIDLSGSEWLLDTFLTRIPITWFAAITGTPAIEINGGAFAGNVSTFASSQSVLAMLSMGIGDLNIQFPDIVVDGVPYITINGGKFDNMINLVVTSPNDIVTIGGADKMDAELRNIVLQPGASVGIDTNTFQRGRYTISVYEETDFTAAISASFQAAISAALDAGSDKLWPGAQITELFENTPIAETNGLIIVRNGAPFQADFIPYGFPGYRFKTKGDDLIYELIAWEYTVTIANAYSPDGATITLPAWYQEPMTAFPAVKTANGQIFLGCTDSDGIWYYDNNGASLRNWDKDFDGELQARWFDPAADTDWVAFFANGGAFIGADSDSPHMYMQLAAVVDGIYPIPATPTSEGLSLASWNTMPDGSGATIIPGVTEFNTGISTQTLYAIWADCLDGHTVNLWHATGSTPDTYDTTAIVCGAPMPPGITPPTSPNGTFIGYFDPADQMRMYYDADMTSVRNWDKHADGDLTASYTTPDYASFHANGGAFEGASGAETYLQEIETLLAPGLENTRIYGFPAAPTRLGYTFTGWNTKADGTGDAIEHNTNTPADALLLFARWQIETTPPTTDPKEAPEPIKITSIDILEGIVYIKVESANPAAPGVKDISVYIKSSADLTSSFALIPPGGEPQTVTRQNIRDTGVTFDIQMPLDTPACFYRAYSDIAD